MDNQGIRLSNEWELSFFDRSTAFESIEKDLQLCELCGAVIGCKDHLTWIAENLGTDVRLNLMDQYRPEWKANQIPELRRRLTQNEFVEAKQIAKNVGLSNAIT